ncbi:hypothetical protein QFC22_001729 [Naganishia vaughanmartiniae]|uniref:Uncharacterized protein n=1 Tax=Naganishia vaughanmartiniae TaxID=1424756 RepID=A0ACC2XER0_9TREE|nr:hypothetical protein QFC22_001729 [Naganishia vaughanmartiniae]
MQTSHAEAYSTGWPDAPAVSNHLARRRRFVIDDLVVICSRTIFSPAFALLLPATTAIYLDGTSAASVLKDYSQGRLSLEGSLEAIRQLTSGSKVLRWTIWYAGAICLTSFLSKLSYAYDQGVGLFSRPKPLVWAEEVVVVTGGGSGVGRSIVDKAAERGAKVVILDVAKPCDALQENIWCYVCDVSDRKAVNKVALKVIKEVGVPTILINNAGVMAGKLILDLREQDVTRSVFGFRTFGVNTISHFWILQAFLPGLIAAGKGHIVSVASLLGITGSAQLTPTLEPGDVAEAIIDRIDRRENGTLRMPLYSHVGRLLGLAAEIIPSWARDLARWAAQSDAAMRRYGGRAE